MISASQLSATGAYARAETLVATLPVRAIDPTRQRFQVGDQVAGEDASAQAQSQAEAADSDGASSGSARQQAATGWGSGGYGLLGAFTSFLTRMFSQGQGEQVAGAPAMQSGIRAYNRFAAGAESGGGGAEVLPPGFPRLSSGRAVDLSV